MTAALIGLFSGLLIIIMVILKGYQKRGFYGLILSGIGFLYVGFAWQDLHALVMNSIQAMVFLNIAYYGMQKNINILAAGFFLHGGWDMAYDIFGNTGLIPPQYDWFCLTLDFVIGTYILIYKKHFDLSVPGPVTSKED